MSEPKTKTLILYTGDADDLAGQKAVATVTAHHLVICSQYCDLRDAADKLVATITWTSPVKCREVRS